MTALSNSSTASSAPPPGPEGDIYYRRATGLVPTPSPVRLWIDAHQPAPEGWYWVTTSAQALRLLKMAHAARLEIMECSLVHDLSSGGTGATHTTDTTRPVVEWMCENNFFPRILRVHCADDADRHWLEKTLSAQAPIGCVQPI